MKNRMNRFFDRHWSFVVTDTFLVFGTLAAILSASLYFSFVRCDWALVGRSGNLIVLAGVLLSLRRLFRLGYRANTEQLEPWTLPPTGAGPGVQFNVGRMNQETFAAGDARVQVTGAILIAVGTVVASYGDLMLDWFIPFIRC